jgi:nucleotide-binding universal stress UspA family protein
VKIPTAVTNKSLAGQMPLTAEAYSVLRNKLKEALMKPLEKILIPSDLSEHSRRAVLYGCWLATEQRASVVVLYVANELRACEFYSDEFSFVQGEKNWPVDRVLAEASLDLSRFLESSISSLKECAQASKRVVLGPVAKQIAAVAEEEKADLVIMSPRRHAGLRHWFYGSVTDQVTRLSPCPVLSIAEPLPSKPWRGKVMQEFFKWTRPKTASL